MATEEIKTEIPQTTLDIAYEVISDTQDTVEQYIAAAFNVLFEEVLLDNKRPP